uniref:2-oxoacid dehydrogenase acyltransferase catalytic domain-containing protein n=1 Tax=Anaerolinea thermolimosa TaxID=229919 RepID=A0A7C4KI20_9CHLR
MVFSYLWKDNALFRVAIYLFVGVSAGYVGAVACRQVLLPRLILPLTLTFDHRVVDGFTADGFLAKVVEALESW